MKVFVDSEFKVHTESDGTMLEVDDPMFDDKCRAYIEGYCIVPAGAIYTREDGRVFAGPQTFAWRDYSILIEFQRQYEEMLAQQEDMKAALDLLGVTNEEETA